MAQQERVTTPKALWVLLIAGPIIVALEQQINFILVRQACSVQRNLALYVVTLVAILLTVASILVAVSLWRRTGARWPTEEIDLANRIRFISVVGMLSSVMSFLVIVAQGIATIYFNPCEL